MGKTYTLEDGEGLMAEMRGRRRSAFLRLCGSKRSEIERPLRLSKNLLTIKFTSK